MPHLYEIGKRRYAQFLRLNRGSPLWEKSTPTQETSEPYRVGRGTVIRLWPTTFAVVFGQWTGRVADPAVAELAAMRLVMVPRQTDSPNWCANCGNTNCVCALVPVDDRGICPVCGNNWIFCQCLEKAEAAYYDKRGDKPAW